VEREPRGTLPSMQSPRRVAEASVDRRQAELLHCHEPSWRLARALDLSQSAIELMKRGSIRRREPGLPEREVLHRFVELCYGAELARSLGRDLDTSK
jgi:hypothetical protein